MRISDDSGDLADVAPAPADFTQALSDAPDPFAVLERILMTGGPLDGDSAPDADGFGRPRRAPWLGVDALFRIGHDY